MLSASVVECGQKSVGVHFAPGQCTDSVSAALRCAGAAPADFSDSNRYKWGNEIALTDVKPGDVIQMHDVGAYQCDGITYYGTSRHTVLVEKVEGKILTVLNQNVKGEAATSNAEINTVVRDRLNLGCSIPGRIYAYRPRAQ